MADTVAESAPPGAGPQNLEASDDGDDRYGVEDLDWGGTVGEVALARASSVIAAGSVVVTAAVKQINVPPSRSTA